MKSTIWYWQPQGYHPVFVQVPLVFRLDEGSCSSTCLERDKPICVQPCPGLKAFTEESQQVCANCSWQGCQSVLAKYKCTHKDPMNCSKWQMTEHFLSRQFMHAFEYFTLTRTWRHQRGFPVLLGSPVQRTLSFSLEIGIGGQSPADIRIMDSFF